MPDIKGFRKKQKMTQMEFAAKIGVANTTISSIETGRNALTEDVIERITEAFGASWNEYYGTSNSSAESLNILQYIKSLEKKIDISSAIAADELREVAIQNQTTLSLLQQLYHTVTSIPLKEVALMTDKIRSAAETEFEKNGS